MLIWQVIFEFPIVLVQPIAVVEFRTHAPVVTRTTRDFDAPRLLTAIANCIGDLSFTCTDLIETIEGPTKGPAVEELRAVIGRMTARKLGEALEQIQGENFGGFRVERLGREAGGIIRVVLPAT